MHLLIVSCACAASNMISTAASRLFGVSAESCVLAGHQGAHVGGQQNVHTSIDVDGLIDSGRMDWHTEALNYYEPADLDTGELACRNFKDTEAFWSCTCSWRLICLFTVN